MGDFDTGFTHRGSSRNGQPLFIMPWFFSQVSFIYRSSSSGISVRSVRSSKAITGYAASQAAGIIL
jgi:hypothetical protein